MFPLLPQILLLIKVAMWLVKQINVLFKSGFFLFSPFPYIACLPGGFFVRGVATAPVYKAYRKVLALTVRAWVKHRRAGGGEARSSREICSSQSDTFSRVFPCIWVTCVLFPTALLCPEVVKPAVTSGCVPPGCVPPWMGPSELAFSWLNWKVAGHIPAVMWNLLYQGAELSWHLASSLRVALNLHINLHRSLIGDKCTCFLFIELCKCIHRFALKN